MTHRNSLAALAGAVLALAACSDPTRIVARYDTITDTLSVFALNGTPSAYPTALVTPSHTVVRTEAGLEFDLAFDIDASGNAVLYPFKAIVDPAASGRRVGIQKATVAFDSLKRAPGSGYNYDSATVAPKGSVAVIQASRALECQFDYTTLIYSKIIIDDIDTVNRRIDFRILVDPDCGFRDLVPGRPRR